MPNPDLLVIGGGSGGIAAARRAAEHGARVCLIERAALGGTCVNVGCVPKKIMWQAAQLREDFALARGYGFALPDAPVDWRHLKQARDSYIAKLRKIYADNLTTSGVTHITGEARFTAPHTLQVNDDTYTAPHIIIATGGHPQVPDLPGAELGITSDGFFELETRPERALVVGAGYIAVELAGVLHGLGSETTLALRKDLPLRSFDPMLGKGLLESMRESGMHIRTRQSIGELRQVSGGIEMCGLEGEVIGTYDCVLWAIGRAPASGGLELEATGLTLNERGFIPTDAQQNTEVAGIYALGDVTGRTALTPVAIAAGRHLADRLFGGKPEAKLDYRDIPSVVFSHPPIGSVGLTEPEAREQHGGAVRIYQSEFTNLRHALGEHKPRTRIKLIVAGEDERVIGCHLLGDGVDEILQGFAVAIKMGATKADLDRTVAIHPTAAEELVTLRGVSS